MYCKAFLAELLWGKLDPIHRLCLLLLSLPRWCVTGPFWQNGSGVILTQFTVFVCCCCRYPLLLYYSAVLAEWLWGKIDTIHRLRFLLFLLPLWCITEPFWQSGSGVKLTQFTVLVCCCCRYPSAVLQGLPGKVALG